MCTPTCITMDTIDYHYMYSRTTGKTCTGTGLYQPEAMSEKLDGFSTVRWLLSSENDTRRLPGDGDSRDWPLEGLSLGNKYTYVWICISSLCCSIHTTICTCWACRLFSDVHVQYKYLFHHKLCVISYISPILEQLDILGITHAETGRCMYICICT